MSNASAAVADAKSRGAASVLSCLAADAAAMPLHWIYDTEQLKSLIGGNITKTDFFHTPSCPFYNYQFGENTPYGQQQRQYVSSFANQTGSFKFSPVAAESAYRELYSTPPCSTHNIGRSGTGCYWDASTKGFMSNELKGKHWPNCGAQDTQANGLVHAMLLVAIEAGSPDILTHAEQLIRVTQNTDQAVAFGLAGARILEKVVLGTHRPHAAILATIQELENPNRKVPHPEDADLASKLTTMMGLLDKSNFDVVQMVGQSCDYPNNLLTGAHLIAQLDTLAQTDPASAVLNATRQTIFAGGDSGSRSAFVAAVLGGVGMHESSIPPEWKTKYSHYSTVLADVQKLFTT